jgi:hypothetical protein
MNLQTKNIKPSSCSTHFRLLRIGPDKHAHFIFRTKQFLLLISSKSSQIAQWVEELSTVRHGWTKKREDRAGILENGFVWSGKKPVCRTR